MAKDLYQRETWKKHHVLQHAENVTNIKKSDQTSNAGICGECQKRL